MIFGASPGPLYRAGFIGSFVCLCAVVAIAAVTYVLLRRENARRDTVNGAQFRHGSVEEDLTDMENLDFRYVL